MFQPPKCPLQHPENGTAVTHSPLSTGCHQSRCRVDDVEVWLGEKAVLFENTKMSKFRPTTAISAATFWFGRWMTL